MAGEPDKTRKGGFPSRTFLRYVLFQVPEWTLVVVLLVAIDHYSDAPTWLLVLGGFGFALKDLLLYPWMRRAYELVGNDPGEHLVGRPGTVIEELSPDGWVRVNAELWRATASDGRVVAGTSVRIRALRGHVLLVEPDEGTRSA